MDWQVVHVTIADVVGGALVRLDKELGDARLALIRADALVPGGVVYSSRTEGSIAGNVSYYFSPVAVALYGAITAKHGAKPCKEPDVSRLSVVVSDPRET